MPKTTTTQSTEHPYWEYQKQYAPGYLDKVKEFEEAGPQVAGTNEDLDAGTEGIRTGAGTATDLAGTYADYLPGIISGDDATTQRLARQAGGAAANPYTQAGTLGSARQQRASAGAAADTIANRQMQALGMIPQAQLSQVLPGQWQQQSGMLQRGIEQEQLNAPYTHLNQVGGLYGFGPGFTGPQTTTTTNNQQATGWEKFMGGLSAVTGIAKLFGLSDHRVKSNINKVGSYAGGGMVDGPDIYSYYNEAYDRPEVGVMAQEVEMTDPDLVAEGPSGYKMVDYEGLNDRYAGNSNPDYGWGQ